MTRNTEEGKQSAKEIFQKQCGKKSTKGEGNKNFKVQHPRRSGYIKYIHINEPANDRKQNAQQTFKNCDRKTDVLV